MVGDDQVGARPLDGGEALERDRTLVEPAALAGRLDHRVLPAHVVRDHRHLGVRIVHPADDVEVGEGGLDHEEVGSFLDIERRFPERLAHVPGVHLVGAPIAELGRTLRGVAERSVECRGVLDGVGHDGDVFVSVLVEPLADDGDHAVDHAARRDDVGAGPRVAHRDAGEDVQGLVVQHVAGRKHRVLVVQHPAVAVVGVLAQAHVGDDQKLGQRLLQRTHGALDDAVVVEVLVADRILGGRDSEEQHRADTGRRGPSRLLDRPIDGELADPRHRRDRVAHVLAVDDEQRVDEVGRCEFRLPYRRTELRGVAQAARPVAQGVGRESRSGVHGRSPGRWTGAATITRAAGALAVASAPGPLIHLRWMTKALFTLEPNESTMPAGMRARAHASKVRDDNSSIGSRR